jgi:hypothetical protein
MAFQISATYLKSMGANGVRTQTKNQEEKPEISGDEKGMRACEAGVDSTVRRE